MPQLPNTDVILLIILGGFVLYGLWFGLIHALGGLMGIVVGTLIATRLYGPVAAWAISLFGGSENLMRLLAFALIFILVTRLVGLVFYLLLDVNCKKQQVFYLEEKIFKFISVIPFLKTINRLAGAILGLIEGLFLIGGIIYVMAFLPMTGRIQQILQSSRVANYLVKTYQVMSPLLPKTLRDFDPRTYFPNFPK